VLRASEALAGRARTWWDDRCARVRLRTWQQFSDELTKELDREEVLKGLRVDFNWRRQGRTESSVDFLRRQLDVAARLYPTRKDSELIAVLTLGLQPGVRALVQAARPANFAALLDMAKVAQTESDCRDQRESKLRDEIQELRDSIASLRAEFRKLSEKQGNYKCDQRGNEGRDNRKDNRANDGQPWNKWQNGRNPQRQHQPQ